MIEQALLEIRKPLDVTEIEWKVQSGKNGLLVVPYIDARTVINRLNLLGIGNYSMTFEPIKIGDKDGVKAKLSIRVGDHWVHFEDGSEPSDIESFKGAISNAYKRVVTHIGLGMDLYSYPKVTIETNGKYIPYQAEPVLNAITYALNTTYTPSNVKAKGKHQMSDALIIMIDGNAAKVATPVTKRSGGVLYDRSMLKDMSNFKLFTQWQK